MSVVQAPKPMRWRIATDDPILPGAPLVAQEVGGTVKAVIAEPGQKPCWVATSHPSRGSVEVTIYDGCAKYDPRPLVERVEQAIKLALHRHGETEYVGEAPRYRNLTHVSGDFDLREVARAAIRAMHIPTKEMVREASRFGGAEDRIKAEATWETMIEAALAEPTAPR